MSDAMHVRRLSCIGAVERKELARVMMDVVDEGAFVAFMRPLTEDRAENFWDGVAKMVDAKRTIVLVLDDEEGIFATVQLVLEVLENQPHRADVAKLLVHRRGRRRGAGEALMKAVEEVARENNRSVLVLNTVTDTDAARLYERLGWMRVGEIPDYAVGPFGGFVPVTYYQKRLNDVSLKLPLFYPGVKSRM